MNKYPNSNTKYPNPIGGGGGSGTVTSVGVNNTNGLKGIVNNPTTTASISLEMTQYPTEYIFTPLTNVMLDTYNLIIGGNNAFGFIAGSGNSNRFNYTLTNGLSWTQ